MQELQAACRHANPRCPAQALASLELCPNLAGLALPPPRSFPYKPSPAALQHIAQQWGISASECIMVGDSAKDDVVCGNRAGAVTVLLDTGVCPAAPWLCLL